MRQFRFTTTGAQPTMQIQCRRNWIQDLRRRVTDHSANSSSNHMISDCNSEREKELILRLRCLRADQAAMAAFFSACFFVLAASPKKVMPVTSTELVKTGRCPGPERVVV